MIERGGIPQFGALRLHNGTVYRWNRACYGISGDKAQAINNYERAVALDPNNTGSAEALKKLRATP